MDSTDSSVISENWKTKLSKGRKLRRLSYLEELLERFSPSERLLLYGFVTALAVSVLMMLMILNGYISVVTPAPGGALVEGEIGRARFINPVLTLSQSDQDLSALVYSGLMRAMPDGHLVPDIASSYTISPGGTTYTFKLKPDLTFQDGTPLTASDVLFTIKTIQNPDFKSPHRADWEGVSVSSPSADTVVFTLPHPYAPFIDNATAGILPAHLWQGVAADEFSFNPLNMHPVGSGPYKIANVAMDSAGSPVRYDLTAFRQFALGSPNLSNFSFVFYPDTESLIKAFDAHQIDTMAGISPTDLKNITRTDDTVMQVPLPRVFGVFFNQSHAEVLADPAVRAALDAATDKQSLVQKTLGGYAVALNGPIPPTTTDPEAYQAEISTTTPNSNYSDNARTILQNGGWKFNDATGVWEKGKLQLTFSLSTGDEPELVATANALAAQWHTAGIQATVKIYPLSELNTTVLRPRAYDAVLFGYALGRDLDLFAFWHSSQRNDPGLNLALYANATADGLLSQARAESDQKKRDTLYTQFAALVEKDRPAIFLYAPEFIYIVPQSLSGVELGSLTTPSDRFGNAYQWYAQTQRVWSIFSQK